MKPRVLVVDDDTDVRNTIEMMLQSLGCEVVTACDGHAALELLQTAGEASTFDAIFLDVMMPRLSGYGVIKILKSKSYTAKIPVIMLTARTSGDDMIAGYQSGADYYVPKPFTLGQLRYGLDLVLEEGGKKEMLKSEVKAQSSRKIEGAAQEIASHVSEILDAQKEYMSG
ncbi:response regulator [Oligoflexia bacterium]|nr:response regulator [Oligoflexia bacterium]